jgi:hypothetical protein
MRSDYDSATSNELTAMSNFDEASQEPSVPSKQCVVFVHPDLGIGGAERLIVDAAVGLQQRGHKVVIFTSHCDPNHCFEEARDGQSMHNDLSCGQLRN